MINNKIYLSAPHMSGNEQKYIDEAFNTNWIAPLGPNVDQFERELANIIGIKGAAAISSGTAGIHLALELLGVAKGDSVFCSSLTFVASANPILYLGAIPVFIDSEMETWNMCPVSLENAFVEAKRNGTMPKAVIVVNLYGQSADMDPILEICNQYDVPVIEDAAESLGASYKNRASGTFGKIGIFSFNGNKIITTSGGGMLVSEDMDLIRKAKFLATQARDEAIHYQHSSVGYNYRLSNILAGVGRAQLEVLEDRVVSRRKVFKRYYKALGKIEGVNFMPEPEGFYSSRWLTTLTIDPLITKINSTDIVNVLQESNIEARPVWKPLHRQPLFENSKYFRKSSLSVSDYLYENGVCLPSGSNLTEEEQDKVINSILSLLK